MRWATEAPALADEPARVAGEPIWDLTQYSDLDNISVPEAIGHRLVAAMISRVIGELGRANIGRMLSGMTADEAEPGARPTPSWRSSCWRPVRPASARADHRG